MEKIKMYNREGKAYLVPVGTKKVPVTCHRCGGCGEYSYNQRDGKVCFGCAGSGKRLGKGFTERQWEARQKREEAKRKREEEARQKREEERLEVLKENAETDARIDEVILMIEPKKVLNPSKAVVLLEDMKSKAFAQGKLYTQKQKDLVEKIANDHLKLVEEGAKTSHVGEIGQRMDRELTCVREYTGEGTYGVFYILTMEDSEGNTFVYKGSKPLLEKGESAVITFTVKSHDTWREQKQTVINRPKKK